MTTPRIVDLPPFEGVAAGQRATARVPALGTFLKIGIAFQSGSPLTTPNRATLVQQITRVRVLLNGREQWDITTPELFQSMRKKHGIVPADGYIILPFGAYNFENQIIDTARAFGVLGVDTFEVQVDIAAGVTSPTLRLFAEYLDVQTPPGVIQKYLRYTFGADAAGDRVITTIPKTFGRINRLIFNTTAISDLKIIRDGMEIWRTPIADLVELQRFHENHVSDTGFTDIDFEYMDYGDQALELYYGPEGRKRLAQDFRIIPTMTSGDAFNMLVGFLGPPN